MFAAFSNRVLHFLCKRRLVAFAKVLMITSALAMTCYCLQKKPDSIDLDCVFSQIECGATSADQVRQLFHCPPGDYCTRSGIGYFSDDIQEKLLRPNPNRHRLTWSFDKCEIILVIDQDSIVVTKIMRPGLALSRSRWRAIKDFFTRFCSIQ
jgi:hypothetical protein